jgi:hypothetical protein
MGLSKCNFGFVQVVSLQLNGSHKQPFFLVHGVLKFDEVKRWAS